jgi:uncharacterized RDD family membrane protein YckC
MSYPVPGAQPALAPRAFVIAGVGRRVGAFILDCLAMGVIALVIGAVLKVPGIEQITVAKDGSSSTTYMITNSGWSAALVALVSAVYCIGSWVALGALPAQKMLGLHVFGAAAPQPLALQNAALRWVVLFGISSLLGAVAVVSPSLTNLVGFGQLGWVIVLLVTTIQSPTKQGLHDQVAGSLVVHG